MKRGGEGQALLKFRLRAAAILCETRGHAGYRPCDFCLNVTLFEPTHGQVNPTAAAPAMKRDQLDTQRHGKEVDGDRVREQLPSLTSLLAKTKGELAKELWGTLLTNREIVSQLKAALEREQATAATPTEPPKEDGEMTKAQLIDWLVDWRQQVKGSISPTNHRKLLETRTKPELQKMYERVAAPNGKRDLDGLRELVAKWPHEKELVVPSSLGGFDIHTDDWTAPDLGYQVCQSDCRRCQVEAALAAQRDLKERNQ